MFFVIGLFRHRGSSFEGCGLRRGLGYYLCGGCGIRGDDFRFSDNAFVMGIGTEANQQCDNYAAVQPILSRD
jgi:hypothetical protein